jgi:predicted Zn-dependent protease
MTRPKEAATRLVEIVKQADPSAQALVGVTVGTYSHTRFAANEITTAGDTDEGEVSLTVALGQRHATAETSRLDDEAFGELAERALAMAKLSPEDPEWMPVLGPQSFKSPGPTHDPATGSATPDLRSEAARLAIAVAKEKGVIGAGFFSTGARETALASTAGLVAVHTSSRGQLSITARTTDGSGSGWAAAESQRVAEIDARAVATRAAEKAVASQKPRELDPGKYTVVLEPACVASLLQFLLESMDARRAEEGRSYFAKPGGATRIGETILSRGLTLKSDPFDPLTPGMPFDEEGFALSPTTWFEAGELKALSRSRFWAKKRGGAPTGKHVTLGLYGAPGAHTGTNELVAKVDRGLLVTRFWYTRWLEPTTMMITGLTRDGVYLIEKGKVIAPVANFRFNDSPARTLASVSAWSNDTVRVPYGGREGVVRVPTVVAHDFHMASKSAAV